MYAQTVKIAMKTLVLITLDLGVLQAMLVDCKESLLMAH